MTDEADRTIFDGSELSSEERDAVRKGEERGKRVYMQEHPKCGLGVATEQYRRNYVRIFGHD